uniref:Trafficking protein particle complex subunit n=1 Tax=Haptolina brevifila TaxID=156173 RepID=A0A7S2IS43_9EUKA|mmetsp:Transcript_70639/g.140013  ORF Transcript_70639/g.140013 Transcript_70639/m.140013 type:complete len:138 (+) Transcript_70639:119-532(+)
MGLLSLYVNNKAGGLIYHRDFASHAAKLDVNDQLRLASTFNGLAMIMKQLSPVSGSSQMTELEADAFVLTSFDTLTGLKFFLTADPDSKRLDDVLREVYVYYSDFVLKNPFYELDMPIQCERFEEKVIKLAADYNRR